ncbi:uncharacterized protein HHUB_2368 [Halobacterium hubeiense]|jgi:hypothetical protein|uniref:Uncharacterized protein n=2 Tax=Halobacterium TaxID=2239 RepID=A0A0U5H2W0_9EURY|nr:hypothetical protein [Halobacterium hubeiense]CQH56349.1 uncharacterized protein HHUB_2368 [Halobacterium hubeiense]
MTTHDTQPQSALDDAKAALVDALRDALGDNLRDVWVLDQHTQQSLYLREDVADRIEDVDVEKHLDNERYGFVTRQTYNRLHYSEFRYTHRGFDTWELFRTFVSEDDAQVGVVVGVDANDANYDFGALTDTVHDLAAEYGVKALAPVAPDDA